jgi:dolichol-phosphate mannosyltransferase
VAVGDGVVAAGVSPCHERSSVSTVSSAKSLAVVIPTYNESPNVARIVAGVRQAASSAAIIVVDDNSPDGTGAMLDRLAAADPRVKPIHRREARGYAPSCLAGLHHALAIGAERVVQMDADGSHDPAAIPSLVEASEGHDLVIGSRYVGAGRVVNWPLHRQVLSRWANTYVRVVTGIGAHDVTSGFRCWTRAALDRLPLDRVRSEGYGFLVEMTFLAVRVGCSVAEVPITFVDRTDGVSKMSWKVVMESAWLPWHLVLRRPHVTGPRA